MISTAVSSMYSQGEISNEQVVGLPLGKRSTIICL